jgi:hypothetical protein
MPLPDPVGRRPTHSRRIHCQSYLRDDGLWDIEGHITDVRPYKFDCAWYGECEADSPMHEMWVRLTLDDRFVVQDAVAAIDHSPYAICPQAAASVARLKGLQVKPGWAKQVRERIGGTGCCTHIVDMLGPMATVSWQTINIYRTHECHRDGRDDSRYLKRIMPPVGGCYALATDRAVVKELWPDRYTGD